MQGACASAGDPDCLPSRWAGGEKGPPEIRPGKGRQGRGWRGCRRRSHGDRKDDKDKADVTPAGAAAFE